MLTQRRSGILLHPTSLPGLQPVGSLGRESYAFVDFLKASGQSVWQMLPLGPTGYGNSPYSCFSAFAGNPLLISLTALIETGELQETDLPAPVVFSDTADFTTALKKQLPLLRLACENFRQITESPRRQSFNNFCRDQDYWLNDYAMFEAIRADQRFRDWHQWPKEIRHREPSALEDCGIRLGNEVFFNKYLQFVFFEQWAALKNYANRKGIRIFGDLPIFVAENSADVWANRELFHLDEEDRQTLVAGVPPDYFSDTGQRWGNPLYRWERMAENNFAWWLTRFHWNLELFDLLRVDHFRGFSACWAIPAEETTAENGYWLEALGEQLFTLLKNNYDQLPIVAEDLGIITAEVEQLRDQFALPGMKILQFAFDSGPDNPYLPHNHLTNSVVYTGTHDNNTSLGWWSQLDAIAQQRVKDYLRQPCIDMPWPFIETALASVSKLAIIPLQDILSLPASSRMNTPGTATGNWLWRYHENALSGELADRLRRLAHLYGRDLCFHTEM